jgi:hypothetical protein
MTSSDKSNSQAIVESWASSSETWLVARCVLCGPDLGREIWFRAEAEVEGSQATGHWHLVLTSQGTEPCRAKLYSFRRWLVRIPKLKRKTSHGGGG